MQFYFNDHSGENYGAHTSVACRLGFSRTLAYLDGTRLRHRHRRNDGGDMHVYNYRVWKSNVPSRSTHVRLLHGYTRPVSLFSFRKSRHDHSFGMNCKINKCKFYTRTPLLYNVNTENAQRQSSCFFFLNVTNRVQQVK